MIIPIPKNVSKIANMVATLDGNSLAIMLKLPVKKPELPQASTILKSKLEMFWVEWSSGRSYKRSMIAIYNSIVVLIAIF